MLRSVTMCKQSLASMYQNVKTFHQSNASNMKLVALCFLLFLLFLTETVLSVMGHSLVVRTMMSHSVAHLIELVCTISLTVLSSKKLGNKHIFPVLAQVISLVTLWGLVCQNLIHSLDMIAKTFETTSDTNHSEHHNGTMEHNHNFSGEQMHDEREELGHVFYSSHSHYANLVIACGAVDAILKLTKFIIMRCEKEFIVVQWNWSLTTQVAIQCVIPGLLTALTGLVNLVQKQHKWVIPFKLSHLDYTEPINFPVDPIIAIITGIALICLTFGQLRTQSMNLLLPIPKDHDLDTIKSEFKTKYPRVATHEWHFWREHANKTPVLTVHVKYRVARFQADSFAWHPINKSMVNFFQFKGIDRVTIQPEIQYISVEESVKIASL